MNTENENIWRRDGYHGDNFLGKTLLTRVLASLQHLHTLHGPCDSHSCPHAAVIAEVESALYAAPSPPLECTCDPYLLPHALTCPSHPDNLERARDLQKLLDDPLFQAVDTSGMFPCEPAPPLSHDPHDLAAALLQAMASGATISTGVAEDVPSTVPVTRRLVITRHGQHWGDIQ